MINKDNNTTPIGVVIINKLDAILEKINNLEDAINDMKNNRVDLDTKNDWSGEELYELKNNKNMSWKTLSSYTGIPLSTCQYRVRKYIENSVYDDIII